MKLFQANAKGYGFEFNLREKQLLFKVLSLYPLVPAAHHRITWKSPAAGDERQMLLEESLASHRAEARQRVQALINNPKNFPAFGSGFRWLTARGEMEWILQVLNEVRVGSWLALGSPNLQQSKHAVPTAENEVHYWAMDIAATFEMIFVSALSGDLPVPAD
jgi:hypothetical protein